jgi:hypothetical protein
MTLIWIIAIAALVLALISLVIARHTARRLAEVTHLYWQLKFDHGELKAKVDPSQPAPPAPKATFVPLSAIKKS